MQLEATTAGGNISDGVIITEPMFWYFRQAFERFAGETEILIGIDDDVDIESACLLELFLTLEPIANQVRQSSEEFLSEVGLVEERNQITIYETRREEGLAIIEALMDLANSAYNNGQVLRIRSEAETE